MEKREGGPAPAEIKKTFDAALRKIGKDPVIGTALGLLFMEGKITAPQLAAGLAFARLQGRYDRAIERPDRFTLPPDYGAVRFISGKEPMSEQEVVAAKEQHARMKVALAGSMHGAVTVAASDGTPKRLDGEAAPPFASRTHVAPSRSWSGSVPTVSPARATSCRASRS